MKKIMRITKWLGVFLIPLLALLPLLFSEAMTWLIKDYLQNLGFSQVAVKRLWINPYSASVKLDSIEFIDKDGTSYYLNNFKVDLSTLKLTDKIIHLEKLSIGRMNLKLTEDDTGNIKINGIALPLKTDTSDVTANEAENNIPKSPWHFFVEDISFGDISIQVNFKKIDIDSQLHHFTLHNLNSRQKSVSPLIIRLEVNKFNLNNEKIASNFYLDVESKIDVLLVDKGVEIKTINEVNVSDIGASVENKQLYIKNLDVLSQADILFQEKLSYQLISGLKLKQLKINEKTENESSGNFLNADFVTLEDFQFSSNKPGEIYLSKLLVGGLSLLDDKSKSIPTLFDQGIISISDVGIKLPGDQRDFSANIDKAEMSTAVINFLVDADGDLPQLTSIVTDSIDSSSIEKEEGRLITSEQIDETINLSINQLIIGPKVSVSIEDHTVQPPFYEVIEVEDFDVSNIKLSSSESARIRSNLQLSHNSNIELAGDFSIINESADINATLHQYQLLQVSGYAQKAVGYALESGTINIDTKIIIKNKKMDLDNKILIDQVNLRAVNKDKITQYANKITMPLDQALDLLRDNKNQIQLRVPVTGALDDPDIDLDQIINKALGGAIKKASISMLKFMLQPYSTVISVAKFAGDQVAKVRLDPVVYATGEGAMDESAKDYAEKIAKILISKKSLQLKVCGSTNKSDEEHFLSAQKELKPEQDLPIKTMVSKQINDLAHTRSNGFRQYLIDNFGVQKEKLLICLPIHGEDKSAISGVELLL